MSYRCTASFKRISNDINELYDFFSKLKTYASDPAVVHTIIEENQYYCPLMRMDLTNINKTDAYRLPELEYWITRLFTFKWRLVTYDCDTMVCVLGIPTQLQSLFDGSVYFQNSTDQDYELDEWPLDTFKRIYDRWQTASLEQVIKFLGYDADDFDDTDEFYWRRSAAYREIASPVEDLLYDDKTTHYVQLFRSYDNMLELDRYKNECINLQELWFKESYDEPAAN